MKHTSVHTNIIISNPQCGPSSVSVRKGSVQRSGNHSSSRAVVQQAGEGAGSIVGKAGFRVWAYNCLIAHSVGLRGVEHLSTKQCNL